VKIPIPQILFLAAIVSAYIPPVFAENLSAAGTASASSGQDHYRAELAVDGDMATRWGSNFSDDQWWQIELREPRRLCGLRLHWETAYGDRYAIEVSGNGQEWQPIYEESEGDGRTDLVYFSPVDTRFLRLRGIRRGTGWGYSLWEIDLIDADRSPVLLSSSALDSSPAAAALDGSEATAWQAAGGEQWLTATLPEPQELGGVELSWGDDYATDYRVEVSVDGETWTTVCAQARGNGGRDYNFFPATAARHLRLRCLAAHAAGYALREMKLKSGEEQATPIRHYQAAAGEAPKGWYPWWLRREQEFWTITGVPGDTEESALGETGTFEPKKGSFSVMPFVIRDGRITSWANVHLDQRLEGNSLPLPTVVWNAGPWTLDISAVSRGGRDAASTLVRYRFLNRSPSPFAGQLALAVRPVQLNPAWQYGGMSPLKQVRLEREGPSSGLLVDGSPKIFSLTEITGGGCVAATEGDVIDFLSRGESVPAAEAADAEGRTSAALIYALDVPPGESREVVLEFPLHEKLPDDTSRTSAAPADVFRAAWTEQTAFWHGLLNRFSIQIPEPRLVDILKSNLAYILLNQDGPWTKPGPRNYNHSWIRDGAMTCVALLRMGLQEPVRSYLDALAPMVAESGYVPWIVFEAGTPVGFNETGGEGNEYDSQGQFVFLARQYFDFTGDEAWLRDIYPKAKGALTFARRLREKRLTEEYANDPAKRPYYGVLPESNSHEGYYPAMHSYWDDFWLLRGLKDGRYLAERVGDEEGAAWMAEEERSFRESVTNSILAVIARDRLDYIPGCVEKGDPDATSTAIAIMACEEGDHLPQPYKQQTFDRYFAEFLNRLAPGGEVSFTPYEVRTANAFVRMGMRDRALVMLRHFAADSVRPFGWNHLAEVVHGRLRTPSYIGDMPHTWVGSGYVSSVRTLFAYEDGDRLILAAGIPLEWMREGVRISRLPTQFGTVDYQIGSAGGTVRMSIGGEANAPGGVVVVLPPELRSGSVRLNGESVAPDEKGCVHAQSLPAEIQVGAVR